MIDASFDGVITDFGMNCVGEVDNRRTARQRMDPALGREDVDRIREQVDLDMF